MSELTVCGGFAHRWVVGMGAMTGDRIRRFRSSWGSSDATQRVHAGEGSASDEPDEADLDRFATNRREAEKVLRPGSVAAGDGGDAGECEAFEVDAHVVAGLVPDAEQHALAFVVAGAVLVRLTEVAEGDRSVDR